MPYTLHISRTPAGVVNDFQNETFASMAKAKERARDHVAYLGRVLANNRRFVTDLAGTSVYICGESRTGESVDVAGTVGVDGRIHWTAY